MKVNLKNYNQNQVITSQKRTIPQFQRKDSYGNEMQNLKQEILELKKSYQQKIGDLEKKLQSLQTKKAESFSENGSLQHQSFESTFTLEEIKKFQNRLAHFESETEKIAKDFETSGKLGLKQLAQLAADFIEDEKHLEFKVAAKLAHCIQIGKLQSQLEGRFWQKHQLPPYDTKRETQQLLTRFSFPLPSLIILFQLLSISLPSMQTKKKLEVTLLKKISLRANT